MTQTVFNNGQLAHVWAQRNQDQGRNGSDSFYFYGDTIYSYGSHFPIAKFITDDIVLFNSATYSSTTGRHQSYVRQAIPSGYQIFSVPNIELRIFKRSEASHVGKAYMNMHNLNLAYFKEEAKESLVAAERARKADNINWHMRAAIHLKDQHNAYLRAFKIRRKDWELPNADELVAKAKASEDKARKARAKKLAKIRKDYAQDAVDWRAGEVRQMPWMISDAFGTMLRVKPTDTEMVQTSRSAEFPVKHAIAAYRIIKLCKRDKKWWVKNGHSIHLGHFRIDSIHPNGDIDAGCHHVKWEEIEKIGEYLINRNMEDVA